MPESLVQVTSGAGPKLHTWQRTVGANNVEDEFTIPGEYPLASYVVVANAISTATANAHLLQLMSGASTYIRVRRITIEQAGFATAAAFQSFEVRRVTTAGTGGTAGNVRPFDMSEAPASSAAMTLPTVKGTEQYEVAKGRILMGQSTTLIRNDRWEWSQHPGMKPLIVPTGTANGIVVKNIAAIAAGTVDVTIEFVETAFAG